KLTDGTNELQLQTSSEKSRKQYHQHYTDQNDQLEKFCRQNRIHLIQISTSDDTFDMLANGLGMTHGMAYGMKRSNKRSTNKAYR
ncbi:MAG: hypothetical protein GQ550_03965, partial [Gammaproteobacteria bacterium]|nr:hypothetical protein [Gammaproteobacteria bacterium]